VTGVVRPDDRLDAGADVQTASAWRRSAMTTLTTGTVAKSPALRACVPHEATQKPEVEGDEGVPPVLVAARLLRRERNGQRDPGLMMAFV
jgi:hypothetical protein